MGFACKCWHCGIKEKKWVDSVRGFDDDGDALDGGNAEVDHDHRC
jgi:hypothetical protein